MQIDVLSSVLSRIQGGKALRKGRLTHNAAEGMVISLVGYTLFIFMPTLAAHLTTTSSIVSAQWLTLTGYYGSALLIGLGNGHMWPAFQNMMINVAQHNQRGTANSTILIAWDIGMGIGILMGGVVAEHLGYSVAFWMVALVNALGVSLYFVRTRRFFLTRRISTEVK